LEPTSLGYVIDTGKCIGCGRCANACKLENDVPFDEPVYRTWVERYRTLKDSEVKIDSPNGSIDGFEDDIPAEEIKKAFYVPKICNHCENAPCVQVCPVGATYETEDGVVLVDYDYCIGCRYCIQDVRTVPGILILKKVLQINAHGVITGSQKASYLHVFRHVRGARKFGDLKDPDSEINKILDKERINVLKPDLGTKPKYTMLDWTGK